MSQVNSADYIKEVIASYFAGQFINHVANKAIGKTKLAGGKIRQQYSILVGEFHNAVASPEFVAQLIQGAYATLQKYAADLGLSYEGFIEAIAHILIPSTHYDKVPREGKLTLISNLFRIIVDKLSNYCLQSTNLARIINRDDKQGVRQVAAELQEHAIATFTIFQEEVLSDFLNPDRNQDEIIFIKFRKENKALKKENKHLKKKLKSLQEKFHNVMLVLQKIRYTEDEGAESGSESGSESGDEKGSDGDDGTESSNGAESEEEKEEVKQPKATEQPANRVFMIKKPPAPQIIESKKSESKKSESKKSESKKEDDTKIKGRKHKTKTVSAAQPPIDLRQTHSALSIAKSTSVLETPTSVTLTPSSSNLISTTAASVTSETDASKDAFSNLNPLTQQQTSTSVIDNLWNL